MTSGKRPLKKEYAGIPMPKIAENTHATHDFRKSVNKI